METARSAQPMSDERKEAYAYGERMAREGKCAAEIVTTLATKTSVGDDAARQITRDVLRLDQADAKLASSGPQKMVVGALLCIGGVVGSAMAYHEAVSNGGGTYIVATGAILGGAVLFLRGLSLHRANRTK